MTEKGINDKLINAISNAPASANKSKEPKNLNRFPIDIFPADIQKFATEANKNLGFPIDYVLASVLSVSALAIGNAYEIFIKNTWKEKPILNIALVGRPGDFKSPSINLAFAPIVEHDKRQYAAFNERLKEYKKELQAYKESSSKEGKTEPEKPAFKRLLVGDHTIEALCEVLKNNRAVCVKADELKAWFGSFGRYNKDGAGEFWLSAFNGSDINVIRKTTDPLYVHSPFLSVIGGTQIGILEELGKEGRDKNGFTDRILFAYPDEVPQNSWRETDLPASINERYHAIINRLLELPRDEERTTTLYMSNDAKPIWIEWFNSNAAQKFDAHEDSVSGIYTKLETYTLRFSLIMQLLLYVCNETITMEISDKAMRAATRLAEYFRHTALKASSIITHSDPLASLPADFVALYNALPSRFKATDAAKIAESMKFNIVRLYRFYKKQDLFEKISYGEYKKVIDHTNHVQI